MKKETSVNELIRETAYAIEVLKEQRKDPVLLEALEQYGVIELQGKKTRRIKKLTPKGVKQALNISLNLEEEGGEKDG